MYRHSLAIIAVAWLAVSVLAMLTGHAEALPAIGRVLVDVLDALLTRPLGAIANNGPA